MDHDEYHFAKAENMWLFATFDLPTETKENRYNYTLFRRRLLAIGFSMLQYSVYAKFCSTRKSAKNQQKEVKKILPPRGEVRIFMVTDMQYLQMEVYQGKQQLEKPPEEKPQQLMLF